MACKPMSDRPYLAWLHQLPCCVSGFGCLGPIQAHHVRRFGERKDDRRAVPLCREHHLSDGAYAVHRMGRRKFQEHHGIDFEALISRLNSVWQLSNKAAA